MGANATTFVPAYVSGEVLTAADLTVTNSGIPVFADSTARTAAFGGTGEKVLAEGQYAYLESDNSTSVWDGVAWQPVGASGLVLVKTQTIGSAVASVTVSDAFSATYDSYKIVISGGSGSTAARLNIALGATTTGYYFGVVGYNYGNSLAGTGFANTTAFFDYAGYFNTDGLSFNTELINPNLAKNTFINCQYNENKTNGTSFNTNGYLANTTAYTAFTIGASSGTLTGGTIRVYGYANS
jgi:hypothetical protein